jgi:poly(3-hydroxybutyrate) depolymerase/prenyltransferase beta subunit
MNWHRTGLLACLLTGTSSVFAQTPGELALSGRYVAAFQNPDGGFAATPGGASTLNATSSAVRTLKNTGGAVADILGCIKYIKSCFDETSGGFAPTPGGKPDVATTAVGLMVVAELKIAEPAMIEGGAKFFSANAKTFEEIRIAVAGHEAVKTTSSDNARWKAVVLEGRNDDGTFGSGVGKARETGGRAVALLRMGETLDNKEAIVTFLKSSQQADGAWSKDGKESELESTYRIMRLFFMINESPNLDSLEKFIVACRHSDGGYGVKPGAEASLSGTYYATTVLRWARLLRGEPALVETAGFRPLFNGKDLTGWEGETSLWSARHGLLLGSSEKGLKNNEFLATDSSFTNFVCKLTFRVRGEGANSGVQFRSVRIPGHEMSGFQADVGQKYWGCLYDESRRNRILVEADAAAVKTIRNDGWNNYVIDAKGDDIRLALNGVTSVQYHETEANIARTGKIAVQMHAGGPITVEFKDIYIQPLPDPRSDSEESPGFHLRTLKRGEEERKYTLYLPAGYDAAKSYPVVVFLHGSGERGDDGVKQAQVGLGPAILNNPERFPLIAVFPQARKTWAADSDDAKAALDTLDEVIKTHKVDPKKVMITGLSMGGRGTWEIASAHPDRFSAAVTICGQGNKDSAAVLAKLPLWAIVGDADRDQTVLNARTMVEAITAAGGKPKYTEYRAVGHNSWDRAYNDAGIMEWMQAQARQ